jgi:hypothetical protein
LQTDLRRFDRAGVGNAAVAAGLHEHLLAASRVVEQNLTADR